MRPSRGSPGSASTRRCSPRPSPRARAATSSISADPDAPHPILEAPGDAAAALAELAAKAKAAGLALYLDIVLDRVAAGGALLAAHPDWFETEAQSGPPDPRQAPPERGTARARWEDPAVAEALGGWWEERLRRFAAAGVAGFRCDAADPGARPPSGAG